MIPRECKRLIEVDFPIAVVSKHAAREKSGPKGYPSTLHLWWARRPLAACRAVLMGLLLPDPCDAACPKDFKSKARTLLEKLRGKVGPRDEELRKALLVFIGDFANWDVASHTVFLEVGRGLVNAAHPRETPLVVDPFAGGGSIPLEALRLGCEAFASDLNPMACLILKVMLEDIPRHGPKLADELRRAGNEIKEAAEKELADLYPPDADGAQPIAYLWARTVRCEAPNCGAEIPIYKSAWLSKKRAKKARFFREDPAGPCRTLLISSSPRGGPVEFRIARGEGRENASPGFIELRGTKARGNYANAVCPCCNQVLPGDRKSPRVQAQLSLQRGGARVTLDAQGHRVGGARLLAVVTLAASGKGKDYRLPVERDYVAVRKAQDQLARLLAEWERGGKQGLCPVPDEPLPPIGTLGFRVRRYGMLEWGDLFTARQAISLLTYATAICRVSWYGRHIVDLLACALSRVAMSNMSCTRWNASAEKMQHTFGRQALPIVWDFAEVVPPASAPGNWESGFELVAEVCEAFPESLRPGQVQLADAIASPLAGESASHWFTDPPYYDAIPYSDLSDFFFVWLKRVIPRNRLVCDPSDPTNPLTPKAQEIVQDETKLFDGHVKDRGFFEAQMARAFAEGRRVMRDDGVGAVVFAHKTTEGWEALLSGMIAGGWVITGSWPIATEMGTRLRARESAALATSVHLVCRPRLNDTVGDWQSVARELPRRVRAWMERLEGEGVRGADLVFACIGPALEIYSRYAKVVDAEDREIPLGGDPEAKEPHKRGYLAYVWETVARIALEQVLGGEGRGAGLEEDARLTALFLWTLQSTAPPPQPSPALAPSAPGGEAAGAEEADEGADDEGGDEDDEAPRPKKRGFSLVFDVARRFSQPLGIHLDDWEHRIIEIDKGIVRLLPVTERAKQLFGEEGADEIADALESRPTGAVQLKLFEEEAPRVRGRGGRAGAGGRRAETSSAPTPAKEATTLDRVHAAMLLQRAGRSNALRAMLAAERDRGPAFERLANALTALYPPACEERRLLEAMLLAMPRS